MIQVGKERAFVGSGWNVRDERAIVADAMSSGSAVALRVAAGGFAVVLAGFGFVESCLEMASRKPRTMRRLVMVSKDSAVPCSQSMLARMSL